MRCLNSVFWRSLCFYFLLCLNTFYSLPRQVHVYNGSKIEIELGNFEDGDANKAHLIVQYGSLTKTLGEIFEIFSKYVRVFDLYFVATKHTPNEKLLHAAHVLYQYIDNNGDGQPDNLFVYEKLVNMKATMMMFKSQAAGKKHNNFRQKAKLIGVAVRELDADETKVPGKFDRALEECFHLLSAGYSKAYPSIFGYKRGSYLADCCDQARGGYFKNVPKTYPPGAWFTYYDKTCDYWCQINEYIYWAMTSILGAQKHRPEVLKEWRFNTRKLVENRDHKVYALLTNEMFKLPTKLPKLKDQILE